jgi:hypothetical protein
MIQKNYLLALSVILMVLLVSYWLVNRQRLGVLAPEEMSVPSTAVKPLTDEEIAELAENLSASEDYKELSLAQKQNIEKNSTAPPQQNNLNREDTEKLLQSLTAPQ